MTSVLSSTINTATSPTINQNHGAVIAPITGHRSRYFVAHSQRSRAQSYCRRREERSHGDNAVTSALHPPFQRHRPGLATRVSLVEAKGLEPSNLLTASQALYQLSYAPGTTRHVTSPGSRARCLNGRARPMPTS